MAHEGNHICLHRFSFIYAVNDLREDAYTCPIYAMNRTTESANLRYGTLGYKMDVYEGMAKIDLHSQSKLIITSVNRF
mgnify:FL=1